MDEPRKTIDACTAQAAIDKIRDPQVRAAVSHVHHLQEKGVAPIAARYELAAVLRHKGYSSTRAFREAHRVTSLLAEHCRG